MHPALPNLKTHMFALCDCLLSSMCCSAVNNDFTGYPSPSLWTLELIVKVNWGVMLHWEGKAAVDEIGGGDMIDFGSVRKGK